MKRKDVYNIITSGTNGHKDMISVKDKNGNTLQVHKDDKRIKSGELVGVTKGNKWITNTIINKCVPLHKLQKYLKDGWILGRNYIPRG